MAELGKLSDEQLKKLYEGDFSSLSDEDLKSLYQGHAAQLPLENPITQAVAPYVKSMFSEFGKNLAATPGMLAGMTEPIPGMPLPGKLADKSVEKVGQAVGGWHQPQSPGEELAGDIGSALASTLTTPIYGNVGQFAKGMATYGVGGGALTNLAEKAPPLPDWVPYAGGKNIAPVLAPLAAGLSPRVARRGVTPLPITDEAQAANVGLVKKNIGNVLSAGQETGRKGLARLEGDVAGEKLNQKQAEALTKAITKKGGKEATNLAIGTDVRGPNTYNINDQRIAASHGIEDVLSRNPHLLPDTQLINDINTATNDPTHYKALMGTLSQGLGRPTLFTNVPGLGRALPSRDYQYLRSKLYDEASSISDSRLRDTYHKVGNALDDAWERSIQATNPQDAGKFAKARNVYETWLTAKNARLGAGATNQPTADQWAAASKTTVGGDRYAKNQGLADIVEPARTVMQPFEDPNSQTSLLRQIKQGVSKGAAGTLLGGAAGLALATHGGQAIPGLDPTIAGEIAGPAILGGALGMLKGPRKAALMNPLTQSYLKNQAMPPPTGVNKAQQNFSDVLRALMEDKHMTDKTQVGG